MTEETIEDMDEKIKHKDNESFYLGDKIGISDEQFIGDMQQKNLVEY